MSLYKSKGLTARLVVIAGCVAGIMPSIDAKDPPAEQERQRQEQRRLFYVGITRTTETLMINSSIRMLSAAAFRMRMPKLATAGMYVILQASPMLPELGPTAPLSITAAAWRAQLGF
jgi:superfamily I DNA/RNA helicase